MEVGNRKSSAIVIIVRNKLEASRLYAKGLRFSRAPKVVKKYWKARSSSICMTCSGIGHDQLGRCNKSLEQYVIYVRAHKTENHAYRVIGYGVKKKIYIYIILRYTNYDGNHQATVFRCPVKQKTQALI